MAILPESRQILMLCLLVLGMAAGDLCAQDAPESEWNSVAALQLVDRGIAFRANAYADSTLQNYSADGRGFVYFLLDAPELDRQSLVRTDQVALEVYWQAPNQIRQRVVGLRQQQELPVRRLYYYLDRMTVVQDNYGQAIEIADGDNVSDVPHPVVAGAPATYDYRIAGRLTLRLPGLPDPVRVVELQVRPKDRNQAAIAGSVFLAEDSGALVRMSFTFTPAAYVDDRLDYIHVSLENGLWQGRYWLPYEQRLEIRRELPELDLPFGTVIRTRMRIAGYEFNQDLPEWLFAGRREITFLPEAEREAFPFEEPIDAQLRLEGIGQPADVDEIRSEARRVMRDQALSGLPTSRLGIGSVSDIFAYNRAEGLRLGAGVAFHPRDRAILRLHGGWAFGPDHPTGKLTLQTSTGPQFQIEAFANRAGDIGHFHPISGAINSLAFLFAGDDFVDPFFESGVGLSIDHRFGPETSLTFAGEAARQRSAQLTTTASLFDDSARGVRPIDPGTSVSAGVALRRDLLGPTGGWNYGVGSELSYLNGSVSNLTFGRVWAEADYERSFRWNDAALESRTHAGTVLGDPSVQKHYFGGGRGTIPGYDFRTFAGRSAALWNGVGSAYLLRPWARGRLLAGAGWIGNPSSDAEGAAASELGRSGWGAHLGIGAGLFYDLLHIDFVRGLGDQGRWQWIVEFQPDFRELL